MEIPLSRPNITQAERDAVADVLNTNSLSLGPRLPEFEQVFARYCQTAQAVAVSSGTAALHASMIALGLTHGDEVITTPFSFVASANCALFAGGRPVFVDIDPQTWNIDPAGLEAARTERTRGVIPVDVFGQVADMDPISAFADRHELWLLEDACEALGATYKGRRAGGFGRAAVFGFYPNKQITTGEGGMITTNDARIAERCRSIRNQGRDSDVGWLAHARLGFNFRLSDIHCALGLAQMARLDEILAARDRVAEWYRGRLAEEERVTLQRCHPDARMSWFVMVLRLADRYDRADRDRILQRLQALGIGCSNYFSPIHLQPFYVERFGYREGDFPVTESLSARTVALPFHGNLTEAEVDRVCTEFRNQL